MMRIATALIVVAIAALGVGGCGESSGGSVPSESLGADTSAELDDPAAVVEDSFGGDSEPPALVTVPDVTGEDGDSAQSDLESEGLTAAFDPIDPADPRGCTVTDQDPVAYTELDTEVDSTDVILTVECPQLDWLAQDGDPWDEFNQAYVAGWDSGCAIAFGASPNGTLYEDDMAYTSIDCELNNPGDASSTDIPPDVPDDPTSTGTALGARDGCVSAFDDLSMSGSLNYGDQSFSSSDCPQ